MSDIRPHICGDPNEACDMECLERANIAQDHRSLKLADELAKAVQRIVDGVATPSGEVRATLSAYLNSRGRQ